MNREERRKMAKRWHVEPALVTELERILAQAQEADPLVAGQKVKLNAEKILSHEHILKDNYLDYVREHADDVFTVESPLEGMKRIVTLVEDDTEPKWFWAASDLIIVE